MDQEISKCEARPLADLCANDCAGRKTSVDERRIRLFFVVLHDDRVRSDDRLTRNRGEPSFGQKSRRGRVEFARTLSMDVKRITGKFSMTFPLQTQFAHLRREVICIARRRRRAELLAKCHKVCALLFAFLSGDRDRHVCCPRRRLQGFGRARVNLVRELDALRVITR